ncbi:MAG: HNH endonuclease signature motif containing protein [Verrucomicrobiota bacterium]
MPFPESVKTTVRRKAHFHCCLCKALGVEIHHIIPQEEDGPDTEDNAAPLCPSCHETYGANPQKRKFIREARDLWYEICEKRFASDAQQLEDMQRMLTNLDSFVRTSNYPLVPFAMFYTLRHTTTPDAIERAFKDAKGYKSLKNDLLQLTGTVRLGGHAAYNSIEFEPKESHCTLSDQARTAFIDEQGYIGESAIKNPNHTT